MPLVSCRGVAEFGSLEEPRRSHAPQAFHRLPEPDVFSEFDEATSVASDTASETRPGSRVTPQVQVCSAVNDMEGAPSHVRSALAAALESQPARVGRP
jgi:hypothetical protein